MWTIDYQGEFRTGDGQWLYLLRVVDSFSRYLLLCDGHGQANGRTGRVNVEVATGHYSASVIRAHVLRALGTGNDKTSIRDPAHRDPAAFEL